MSQETRVTGSNKTHGRGYRATAMRNVNRYMVAENMVKKAFAKMTAAQKAKCKVYGDMIVWNDK